MQASDVIREQLDVIYITLNEAHHLRASIESLKGLPVRVFVVDSGSTDGTVDIALELGVHIVQRPFRSFGDQWNFALTQLPLKAPWTMKLDPDERLTDRVRQSILSVIYASESPYDGCVLQLRLWFMGKPLHVVQQYLRLWKRGRCRFSDVSVNEHPLVTGPVKLLDGYVEHLDSENLDHWLDKQNRYTTLEAMARVSGKALSARPRLFGSGLERRMLIKKWFFAMPGRYFILWVALMLRYGVWRDGCVGLAWVHLRTEVYRIWEYKMMEMKWSGAGYGTAPQRKAIQFDARVPFYESSGT